LLQNYLIHECIVLLYFRNTLEPLIKWINSHGIAREQRKDKKR
jgi:hypothetical protein